MNFKTFYINRHQIGYQEVLLDDPVFEKAYLLENPKKIDIIAIPDGCVDLQFTWESNVCRGYVCGSFLQGKKSLISSCCRCFGLKLQPGIHFKFLKQDVASLVGNRIPLSEFLDTGSFEQELGEMPDFLSMVEATRRFFYRQQTVPIHIIANCVAKLIVNSPGTLKISDMTSTLGYSQRYISNIFKCHFGLSLKKYSDIIRAQTAITYLEYTDIMDVIVDLGYYDQPHFIHDFKQYTSMTPSSFFFFFFLNKVGLVV